MPTTDLSSSNAVVATEILADEVQAAHLPRVGVMQSLCHYDTSLDGARSLVREIAVNTDLGASSAGTEGTNAAATVELVHASRVSGTIATGVLTQVDLTEEVVTTELGITDAVARRMFNSIEAGTFSTEQFIELLRPYVQRMMPMGMQKIEADLLALFSSVTASVGSTSVYATVENLLEAIFAHRRQQPLRPVQEARFALGNSQIERLSKQAYTSGGGLGGSLWNSGGSFELANVPPGTFQGNGFVGLFLNRPVHEIDEELVPTASGGDIGMYGTFGVPGVSATAPQLMGKPGGIEYTSKTPLQIRAEVDTSARLIELVMIARYAAILVNNADLTKVIGLS